jgi:hypothetical protein
MYIETRTLSSVVSLFHEDQVGDGRCSEHSNDAEPQVQSDISIIEIETFKLIWSVHLLMSAPTRV